MDTSQSAALSKVPEITLGFWIIKILATTFGETAGDTVSMSWLGETTAMAGQGGVNGYLVGTVIFLSLLVALVTAQIRAASFHPLLYWTTIIASTTAGTTMADFATRSIGIGYPGGSLLLFGMVLVSLWTWYRAMGSINVAEIHAPRAEMFCWVTITLSQTLGAALGDWLADGPLGYFGAEAVFGASLAVLALLYWQTAISRVGLFWAAFILTRPLGATVGDFLDKPVASGGLELSRPIASAVLIAAIILLIVFVPQRTLSGAKPSSE